MSSVIDAFYKGLRAALTSDAGVTALVAGRVYKKAAGQAATRPYVVFYSPTWTSLNIVAQTLYDVIVTVEAWSTDSAEVSAVFDAVIGALEGQALTIEGWHNYALTLEQIYDLPPDLKNGESVFRIAGDFRVSISQE